ncbi:hypothetical protein MTR_7g079240 [Medicago truncatula]|uniref:Uncharacterized protein n=1 Tax=Medicago truncatula TaxID=3880 RepID=G7KQI8_MEDTR|nr:hypothetical protein MTR_7g079240 [Medicago truncatula]
MADRVSFKSHLNIGFIEMFMRPVWRMGRRSSNNKSALGLLVRHGDKSFRNQTLNLEPYVGPIFKRQVSL